MFRINLSAKVACIFCVIMLLLVMGLSFCFNHFLSQSVSETLLETTSWVIKEKATRAEDLLTRLELFMNLISNDDDTVFDLLSYRGNEIDTINAFRKLSATFENYLDTALGENSNITALFLMDPSMAIAEIAPEYRKSILSVDNYGHHCLLSSQKSFTGETWCVEAHNDPDHTLWYNYGAGGTCILAIKEIRHSTVENRRVTVYTLGQLVVKIDVDALLSESTANPVLKNSLFMLHYNGKLLSGDYVHDTLKNENADTGVVVSIGESKYYVKSALLGSSGLSVTYAVPLDDIEMLKSRTNLMVGAAIIVTLMCGIVLVVVFSKIIVKPVSKLTKMMQNNDCHYEGRLPNTPEIKTLYESYSVLTKRNTALIEEISLREREKREVQIKLLQAQINPHFIYNTLDTACCMAMLNDCSDIADLLSCLSRVLRYSIKNGDSLIPLKDELEIVRQTVYIHRIKASHDFRLDIKCEEALGCLLPKLTIQPLVENALAYVNGLEYIDISVLKSDESLTIFVTDSGTNVDTQRLNQHIEGCLTLTTYSTGIGIRGVDERIKMYFGEEFGLRFDKTGDGYTTAIIKLPLVLNKEDAVNETSTD